MKRMHFLVRCLSIATLAAIAGCGFHLRGDIRLSPSLSRVRVTSSDPSSPLKANIEDTLKRAGATIEVNPGDGIAEIKMTGVASSTNVGSVGTNARVNEFVMVYHVDLEITDGTGKVVLAKQPIEQNRRFTFDQTQAIGTGAEQEQVQREMVRDMTQAIVRKIDALERRLGQ
jgi:LPS-assembly lipoprotein